MEILNKINNGYYSSVVNLHKQQVIGTNELWTPLSIKKANWIKTLQSDFKSPSYKEATLRSLFDDTAFIPIKASFSNGQLVIDAYFKETLSPVTFNRDS